MPGSLQQFKRKALVKPGVRATYDELAEGFAFLDEVLKARAKAGLTQAEVAERMGTTQSVIARLEGGKRTPSMSTVQRYAQAAGCKAVVRLEPLST